MTYELLVLQLDPNRRDGGEMEGVGWKRRRVEARQGGRSEAGEGEGSEAERSKKEARQGGGREGRLFERGAAFAP